MKKLAVIAALLMAASPVAAQSPQQPLGAGGQTNNSQLPNTGVGCTEEIIATFCNVPTSPNSRGYGSSSGATGSKQRGIRIAQHVVHPAMLVVSAGQRTVQLIARAVKWQGPGHCRIRNP